MSDSSLLFDAIENGDAQKLIELLASDDAVKTDASDKHGRTLLRVCAEQGNVNVLNVLLARTKLRCEVNKLDEHGQTPLLVACLRSAENEDMIAALLLAGANPDIATEVGSRAMRLCFTAVKQKRWEARCLLSYASIAIEGAKS
jgi:ankyrin repeat protein